MGLEEILASLPKSHDLFWNRGKGLALQMLELQAQQVKKQWMTTSFYREILKLSFGSYPF
jgi:hypothetical protein